MFHVILCGDSVFDNGVYVESHEPDVRAQLAKRLGARAKVTLLAVDGDRTRDVERQLARLPSDATHLIVSTGGNDALDHTNLLDSPAGSYGEVLDRLAALAADFEATYREMLRGTLDRGLPTAVCTIYRPRFNTRDLSRLSGWGLDQLDAVAREVMQARACAALATFNDVITRAAFAAGLPLIDLRILCDEDADFANPIEPSAHGGDKIAARIVEMVNEHDFGKRRSAVYG